MGKVKVEMMDVMDVSHVEADGRFVSNNVHAGERSLLHIEVCEAAGHYYDGVLAGAMKNTIFVESGRIPSVGTTVTVSFAKPILNRSAQHWEAKGRVIWICPTIDNFGFSRGFAVQIDGGRCGTSEKAAKGITAAKAPAESIHVGQRIMGRLGRSWRRPLPRYEVLGVLS